MKELTRFECVDREVLSDMVFGYKTYSCLWNDPFDYMRYALLAISSIRFAYLEDIIDDDTYFVCSDLIRGSIDRVYKEALSK